MLMIWKVKGALTKDYVTLTIAVEHPDYVPYENIQYKITQQVGNLFSDSTDTMYRVKEVIGSASHYQDDWDDYDYLED